MSRRLPLLAGVALLCACATPSVPHLPPPSPALSDAEIASRVAFIEERLEASRRHGRYWHLGWYAASVAGIGFNTALAATADESGGRAGGIVTAVLAAGGIAYLELMPMNARLGADPLAPLPEATREQRLRKLERAQEILEENAERATVQVNWLAHAANAAVSVASGLIVWGFSDDAGAALVTGGLALLGGEVQFWTEPAAPRRDIEDYVARFPATSRRSRGLHWAPAARGLGLGLRLDF